MSYWEKLLKKKQKGEVLHPATRTRVKRKIENLEKRLVLYREILK